MPTITLLTDFGFKDVYVGVMKGVIASINPRVNIIDICHDVYPHDVFEGAYLLYCSYKYFPKGTIHVAVVDPGVGGERRIIGAATKDYIFLGPDNGILSLVLAREKPRLIASIIKSKYFLPEISSTFHGRDIFAPVAGHLSRGVRLSSMGEKINKIQKIELPMPICFPGGILTGEVIYVDRFGNLITNINHSLMRKMKVSAENMSIKIGKRKIVKLSRSYESEVPGKLLALFNSAGYLEIAVSRGNARSLIGSGKGEKVIIEYGQT